jgi:hypothetical protein
LEKAKSSPEACDEPDVEDDAADDAADDVGDAFTLSDEEVGDAFTLSAELLEEQAATVNVSNAASRTHAMFLFNLIPPLYILPSIVPWRLIYNVRRM